MLERARYAGRSEDSLLRLSISGTVGSLSGDTLSVTTSDGQTVQVSLSGATYHGQTSSTASQVTTGTQVVIQVTAGGGAAAPGASASPGTGTRTFTAKDVTIVSK